MEGAVEPLFTFDSVHFDHHIPNWRTNYQEIPMNVLVLVVDGKVTYTINGEQIIAERGDLIYIPKQTHRAGSNHLEGLHQKYSILFYYEEIAKDYLPFLANERFFIFKIRNLQYLQRRFAHLYEEYRGGGAYRLLICAGIFQELAGMISRELEKLEVTPIKMKYAQTISRYLLEHYREPVEIEQLARLIHRSPNYTIAVFKEVTGQTPIKYLHQLRVTEACNLLLNTDMTVSSISSYLGYYDPSYFFRIFKKLMSMSPTDYITNGRPPTAQIQHHLT